MQRVYQESKTIWILIIVFGVSFTLVLFNLQTMFRNGMHIWQLLLLIFILGSFLLCFYNIKYKIYKSYIEIVFGIGLVKKKIYLDAINIDKVTTRSISGLAGIGLRKDFDGSTIYSARFGSGVVLSHDNETTIIVPENPDHFIKILKNAILEQRERDS